MPRTVLDCVISLMFCGYFTDVSRTMLGCVISLMLGGYFTDMSRTSPGCVTSLMLGVFFTDMSRTLPGCVTSVMLGGYFTDMSCTVLGYVISLVMLGGYNLQTYVTHSATLRDLSNVAWLYFTDRSHTVARVCDLYGFAWLFLQTCHALCNFTDVGVVISQTGHAQRQAV